jgi:hypothetical protein
MAGDAAKSIPISSNSATAQNLPFFPIDPSFGFVERVDPF